MFDLTLLENILTRSMSTVLQAKGKKINLCLGLPGAGKSTLTNYLLGHDFIEDENGSIVSTTKEALPAPVGDGYNPVTEFPSVYQTKDGLFLCDCPGFLNKEAQEKAAATSLVIESAIKISSEVNALLVVMDYAVISAGRANDFLKLSFLLSQLLKNYPDSGRSILFLFNRCPSKLKKESLIKKIEEACVRYDEKVKETQEKLKGKDLHSDLMARYQTELIKDASMYQFFHVMKDFAQTNVFLVDITDRKTRGEIISRLRICPGILREEFIFNDESFDQFRLKSWLSEKLLSSNHLFLKRNALIQEITETNNIIFQLHENANFYNEQFRDFYKEEAEKTTKRLDLSKFSRQSEKTKKLIQELEKAKLSKLIELDKIKNEKSSIDTGKPVVFCQMTKNTSGSSKLLGGVAWLGDLIFETEGIIGSLVSAANASSGNGEYVFRYSESEPFLSVLKSCSDYSYFSTEIEEKERGFYSIKWMYNNSKPCSAVIEIFGEERKLPKNKIQIGFYNSQIKDLEEQVNLFQERITFLCEEERNLQNLMSSIQQDLSKETPDINKVNNLFIEIQKKATGFALNHCELDAKQFDLIKEIENHLPFLKILLGILPYVDLVETQIKVSFLNLIEDYLKSNQKSEEKVMGLYSFFGSSERMLSNTSSSQGEILDKVSENKQHFIQQIDTQILEIEGKIKPLQEELERLKAKRQALTESKAFACP